MCLGIRARSWAYPGSILSSFKMSALIWALTQLASSSTDCEPVSLYPSHCLCACYRRRVHWPLPDFGSSDAAVVAAAIE